MMKSSLRRRVLSLQNLEERRVLANDFEVAYSGFSIPPAELTNVNGTLFFTGTNGFSGSELWKSTGDATAMLKDIKVGPGGSGPRSLVNVNGTLFFAAEDSSGDLELWKSDGTTGGTVRVRDINPTGDSMPDDLTNVGGTLFFTAWDGVTGRQLWKSNGTADGTVRITELSPEYGGIEDAANLTAADDRLFFTLHPGGVELWTSDGTEAGTVMLEHFESNYADYYFTNFQAHEGQLYFHVISSEHEGGSTTTLWTSDGAFGGTKQVSGLNDGGSDAQIASLESLNGKLYILTSDQGIFETDAGETAATQVSDVNVPSNETVVANGVIFFFSGSPEEKFLWKTDGTAAGTVPIIAGGGTNFVAFENKAFFNGGGFVVQSDGTAAGTDTIADLDTFLVGATPIESLGLFFAKPTATGGQLLRILPNQAPVITNNHPAHVPTDRVVTITSELLSASDSDGDSAQIVYHVTTPPTLGRLELVSNPGFKITTFTQDDINRQRVVYKNTGSREMTDQFTFTFTDEAGISAEPRLFTIHWLRMSPTDVSVRTTSGVRELRVIDFTTADTGAQLLWSRSVDGYFVLTDATDDPARVIFVNTIIPGVIGSGTKRVQIPVGYADAVDGTRFSLNNGDDRLTIYTGTGQNPIPLHGLALGMGGGTDTLALGHNNTTDNTWEITQADGGTVQLGALGTIAFTGLEQARGSSGGIDLFRLLSPTASNMTFDGGPSNFDTFEVQANADFTLGETSLKITAGDVTRSFTTLGLEFARLYGGAGDNVIDARQYLGKTKIYGYGGNDFLLGAGNQDDLYGGEGNDVVVGNGGFDFVNGGLGRDLLIGGRGGDSVIGGGGDDILIAGTTFS